MTMTSFLLAWLRALASTIYLDRPSSTVNHLFLSAFGLVASRLTKNPTTISSLYLPYFVIALLTSLSQRVVSRQSLHFAWLKFPYARMFSFWSHVLNLLCLSSHRCACTFQLVESQQVIDRAWVHMSLPCVRVLIKSSWREPEEQSSKLRGSALQSHSDSNRGFCSGMFPRNISLSRELGLPDHRVEDKNG